MSSLEIKRIWNKIHITFILFNPIRGIYPLYPMDLRIIFTNLVLYLFTIIYVCEQASPHDFLYYFYKIFNSVIKYWVEQQRSPAGARCGTVLSTNFAVNCPGDLRSQGCQIVATTATSPRTEMDRDRCKLGVGMDVVLAV